MAEIKRIDLNGKSISLPLTSRLALKEFSKYLYTNEGITLNPNARQVNVLDGKTNALIDSFLIAPNTTVIFSGKKGRINTEVEFMIEKVFAVVGNGPYCHFKLMQGENSIEFITRNSTLYIE